jgi:hypothetical protein
MAKLAKANCDHKDSAMIHGIVCADCGAIPFFEEVRDAMTWAIVETYKKEDDSRRDILNEALEMLSLNGFECHDQMEDVWNRVWKAQKEPQ